MFYRKNIYAWEQIGRFILGAAMIAGGLYFLPGWQGWLVAVAGLSAVVTGVFGYCPACAMIGRKPVDGA